MSTEGTVEDSNTEADEADRAASAALPGHPAVAGVHPVDVLSVEAVLDQPVRIRGPSSESVLPFCLTAFFLDDPPAGAFQVADLHALQEAE
ncbi:hypothetical protein ACFV19_14715 [Streptomyces griseoluteus]|uniref:hypothetical protein n=1 Tax=Streptomyces griseoluteus TaxID=29306 RepID=UPI0036A28E27